MSLRDEWRKTRLEAQIWGCGDEICDCHQAQIERIRPNFKAGFPWVLREVVWRGTFACGGEEVWRMREELHEAARGLGIMLDEFDYGIKDES